ncbi:hypothetical protein RQP46_009812 [Phenoliferia psychrophenolica]
MDWMYDENEVAGLLDAAPPRRPSTPGIPPPALVEIVVAFSKRYEKNRRRALPRPKVGRRLRVAVELQPDVSAAERQGHLWTVNVLGPIFKSKDSAKRKVPRIPGAPGSSWWVDGKALVKVWRPVRSRKMASSFEFKYQRTSYIATNVTRTTHLREEAYTGQTQWMVTGKGSDLKFLLKFHDPDWESFVVAPTAQAPKEEGKDARAAEGACKSLMEQLVSIQVSTFSPRDRTRSASEEPDASEIRGYQIQYLEDKLTTIEAKALRLEADVADFDPTHPTHEMLKYPKEGKVPKVTKVTNFKAAGEGGIEVAP